ncbi:alpha/beta hydrolase [Rhodocytophaga aerolata]|uniref:Alpha/beta hydrolase n=1 Tax=Rhodocytophaga aerolata TaxID=455078 RepID=A0ABT8R2E4_9BACT|nr:alpha/beta hydrolase [Rhodocytophaga aerolata]MDO1444820.1 alpha/beta hydrolase [Rhodocytophaga aerolata]
MNKINMDYLPLKHRFIAAEKPDGYTLLLLHGTGGNENDLIPLSELFGKNVNILSVRGNVLENGMPRFFRRVALGVFDEKDVEFRTHELVHFVRSTAVEQQFDAQKVIALGFSNGANIAGACLMLYPDLLAGAMLLRPTKPLSHIQEFKTNHQTPVFISSGATDPTIRAADTKKYEELLLANGFDVTHASIPAGHHLTQKDVILAVEWFNKYFTT